MAVVQAEDSHNKKEYLCGRPWDDGKPSRSLQCVLAAIKAKSILSSINSSTVSRLREVFLFTVHSLDGMETTLPCFGPSDTRNT